MPLHFRRQGSGFPLLFLHSGWGYRAFPFADQEAALATDSLILIPDRSGYGRSPRLNRFAKPLHRAAAEETLAFMDALGLDRAALWGHSDGAVIAANVALAAPSRVSAILMEATHLDRHKPRSRDFFRRMVAEPEAVGPRMIAALREDHGADYWKRMLDMEGRAWLDILEGADDPEGDLYGGRLAELSVPALVLHGTGDPRTEPGELEALERLIPRAAVHRLAGAGHSPHSEPAFSGECTRLARHFFSRVPFRMSSRS